MTHRLSRARPAPSSPGPPAGRRFGVGDGTGGTVYTRTGRPFFGDTTELVDRLRAAAAPLFESLATDWLALDCELLPWSAKAADLIKAQYASVGAAARHALPKRWQPSTRPPPAASTWRTWPAVPGSGSPTPPPSATPTPPTAVPPTVSTGSRSHRSRSSPAKGGRSRSPSRSVAPRRAGEARRRPYHPDQAPVRGPVLGAGAGGGRRLVAGADRRRRRGCRGQASDLAGGRVQPGLKVRGREYLRIIYGPDYTESLACCATVTWGRNGSLPSVSTA